MMMPVTVRPLSRRRRNASSAVVHWRKYVGQTLAERLQLRCSLLLESDGVFDDQGQIKIGTNSNVMSQNDAHRASLRVPLDSASRTSVRANHTRVIVRLILVGPQNVRRVWDVVRSGAQFKMLEHQLAACGLSGSKIPSLVHLYGAQLVKCLERWLSNILTYWQKEERWGNFFMFPRRKPDVEKAASAAAHLEWFLFDPLPGCDSFQALFAANGYGNFSSAVKRVETMRAAKIYVHNAPHRRDDSVADDEDKSEDDKSALFRRRDTDMSHHVSKQAFLEESWKEYSFAERRRFSSCSDYSDEAKVDRNKRPANLVNWLDLAIARANSRTSASIKNENESLLTTDKDKTQSSRQDKKSSSLDEAHVPRPEELSAPADFSSKHPPSPMMGRSPQLSSRKSGHRGSISLSRRSKMGIMGAFGARAPRLGTTFTLDQSEECEGVNGGIGYRERNSSEVYFARGFVGSDLLSPRPFTQQQLQQQQQKLRRQQQSDEIGHGSEHIRHASGHSIFSHGPGHVRSESGQSMFSCGSDLFHLRFSSKRHSTDDFDSIYSSNETDIDFDYNYDEDSVVDKESYLGQDDSFLYEDESFGFDSGVYEHPQEVDEEGCDGLSDDDDAGSVIELSTPLPQGMGKTDARRLLKQCPPVRRLSLVGQAVEYSAAATMVDEPESFSLFAATVDLSGQWNPTEFTHGQAECECYTPVSVPDTEAQREEFLKEAQCMTLNLLSGAAEKLRSAFEADSDE